MAETYVINGPTTIGDPGQLNQILGNVSLANITATAGDMVYADGINNLTRLTAPVDTSVMLYDNGTGAQPVWLARGNVGEVLTVTSTNVIGWSNVSQEASSYGFSAIKGAPPQSLAGNVSFQAANVINWTTTGQGLYDNTAGAFDATNGIFTIAANGIYQLNAGLSIFNALNNGTRTMRFLRNNTNVLASKTWQPTGSTSIAQNMAINDQFNLTLNDQISLQYFRSATVNANANLTIFNNEETYWGAYRLALQ